MSKNPLKWLVGKSEMRQKNLKRVIILQHDGGELANQLWNYISILAYAIERNYPCINYSFFEHTSSFHGFCSKNWTLRFFSVPFRRIGLRNFRKGSLFVRLWRTGYKTVVVRPITFFRKNSIVYSNESSTDPYYLPPTVATSKKIDLLEKMEGSNKDILFFSAINGGVFRNPDGIRKHHHKIVGIIAPTMSISKKVDSLLEPLRSKYAHVVGVHIRQSDYKTFKNGKYFVDQVRFVEILREYLRNYGKSAQEVGFVVASDGPVDLSLFYELNVTVSKNDVVTDLFTLASCNAVIGSDSTLSHFAAYYGDIPHVIAKNEVMDWNYYLNKKTYFPNKYLTIMLY